MAVARKARSYRGNSASGRKQPVITSRKQSFERLVFAHSRHAQVASFGKTPMLPSGDFWPVLFTCLASLATIIALVASHPILSFRRIRTISRYFEIANCDTHKLSPHQRQLLRLLTPFTGSFCIWWPGADRFATRIRTHAVRPEGVKIGMSRSASIERGSQLLDADTRRPPERGPSVVIDR